MLATQCRFYLRFLFVPARGTSPPLALVSTLVSLPKKALADAGLEPSWQGMAAIRLAS